MEEESKLSALSTMLGVRMHLWRKKDYLYYNLQLKTRKKFQKFQKFNF